MGQRTDHLTNGTYKVVVDGDTIHEWIQTDNKDPQLDEEAIEEFVAEQAKDTIPMETESLPQFRESSYLAQRSLRLEDRPRRGQRTDSFY